MHSLSSLFPPFPHTFIAVVRAPVANNDNDDDDESASKFINGVQHFTSIAVCVCVIAQVHERNDKSDAFLIVSAIYEKT